MTMTGLDRDAIAKRQAKPRCWRGSTIALTVASALSLSACVTPSYIDKNSKEARTATEGGALNPVIFQVTESYEQAPPDCIAVMPFHTAAGADVAADQLFDASRVDFAVASGPDGPEADSDLMGAPGGSVAISDPTATKPKFQGPDPTRHLDRAERVRRAFYSHISPQKKRDIEIAVVDNLIAALPDDQKRKLRRNRPSITV